ncbi:C40 family peptidase [Sporosarcina sp. P17b]|uniref:C40 family peptidase n=1 Tax=Sporosarcina sp. P17b TaxID=2048260 RepID=UPI000C16DD04|nr:NlpC/P60 family protein [Sporosarcina sp. P17b]PIC72435.1 hypothetical protein CSV76_15435 [Sporosarcina sp. P17b]
MIKIIHVTNGSEVDITDFVTAVKWSGDDKQVARVLTFGIVSSPTDKNIPVLNLKMFDMIKMKDGDTEKYRGYVFAKDKSLSNNEIDVVSYDGLIYFLKSKGTYNFKNVTPGAITRRVCKDFGIPTGNIPIGSPIKRIFDGEEIYNIIMTAYTFESNKTKKQYIPLMDKGKLNIKEKGKQIATYVLDPSTSIIDAKYGESAESVINVVKIYTQDGKYKGEVKLEGVPGRLQDVYSGDDGKDGARSLLKGIEKTASIVALGSWDCITGNAVRIQEEHTGLVGLFYIVNDEHNFENGQHKMSLGLAFQNIMDSQAAGEDPDEIAKQEASNNSGSGSSSSGSSSGGNVVGTNKLSKFISAAESMLGYRYSQPNRMGPSSADCSSLVGRAMKMAGITNNAHLTTRSIHSDGRFTKVARSQIRRGDILWQRGHVAIYMGGNRTLEARYSIMKVAYGSLGNRFDYAYRIKGI